MENKDSDVPDLHLGRKTKQCFHYGWKHFVIKYHMHGSVAQSQTDIQQLEDPQV